LVPSSDFRAVFPRTSRREYLLPRPQACAEMQGLGSLPAAEGRARPSRRFARVRPMKSGSRVIESATGGQTKPLWWRYLPTARWLKEYHAAWLPADFVAGMTLAAYAIPVSLAYAALAGLPPQVGIYGYLLGGLGYALLGSSRQLAVGPT